MKTTLDISDSLLREARKLAASKEDRLDRAPVAACVGTSDPCGGDCHRRLLAGQEKNAHVHLRSRLFRRSALASTMRGESTLAITSWIALRYAGPA